MKSIQQIEVLYIKTKQQLRLDMFSRGREPNLGKEVSIGLDQVGIDDQE